MKFKYNVIGDNTAENRKHLELLSYAFEETNKRLTPYLYVNGNNVFFVSKTFALAISIDVKEEYINCIGNDSLFRAVSAIRDDSDYMQWYDINDRENPCPSNQDFLIKLEDGSIRRYKEDWEDTMLIVTHWKPID